MKAMGLLALAAASFAAALPLLSSGVVEAGARREDAMAVAQPPALPDQVLYLIRSTLLALDGANRTGNYSVLRESASSEFQRRNSPADLALAFADLRRRGVDLTPVAVTVPRLSLPAVADAQGRLRLAGQLGGGGAAVGFDLVFVVASGQWRLDALTIGAQPHPAIDMRAGN